MCCASSRASVSICAAASPAARNTALRCAPNRPRKRWSSAVGERSSSGSSYPPGLSCALSEAIAVGSSEGVKPNFSTSPPRHEIDNDPLGPGQRHGEESNVIRNASARETRRRSTAILHVRFPQAGRSLLWLEPQRRVLLTDLSGTGNHASTAW